MWASTPTNATEASPKVVGADDSVRPWELQIRRRLSRFGFAVCRADRVIRSDKSWKTLSRFLSGRGFLYLWRMCADLGGLGLQAFEVAEGVGALAHSCNVAFGELAAELGAETLQDYAEKLGLTGSFSCEGYTVASGKIDLSQADDGDVAWAGIGQYTDQVSAPAFLRYMGAIANGGQAAEPYLMQRVRKGDDITYEAKTVLSDAVLKPETADTLTKLMRNNVQSVYGDWQFGGLSVCAKSGTAEREGQTANAMFAGFALDSSCPVAFVVFVENGGSGSAVAAPMAAKVLQTCAQVLSAEAAAK